MAECRGLAPLARRHALVSTEARHACPVDIPNWSAWGDLHSQGCSVLKRTGLLFPVNHTPVGNPGLAPGRRGDFKSPGSAVPAEASRREMVGMKGLAPPRLPDSESGPSAIRVKPHARKLVHPAGLPPANSPFEAEDDNTFTTDAEMVGRLGFAPSSRRLRAGTSLSKFATQANAKAELNHRGEVCEALADTGISRRGKRIPSAPNRISGHYFDRAGSLPRHPIRLGNGRARE